MTHTTFTLQQNVYRAKHAPIDVDNVHENTISLLLLRRLVDSAQNGAVGVAATYHPDCTLSCLAFATLTRGLVVHFSPPQKANQWQKKKKGQAQQPSFYQGRALLQEHILCDPNVQLFGYRMDRITVAIFMELSLRVNAAVDILSVPAGKNGRRSFEALMIALGGEVLLQRENAKALLFPKENDSPAMNILALQAWAACCATTHMAYRYTPIPRIATDTMSVIYLSVLAKISRHADVLESLRPIKVVNNVKGDLVFKGDDLNLQCTRYTTRIMKGREQVIHIETEVGDKRSTITGRARRPNGRQARIDVKGAIHPSGKIISVTTIGQQDLTPAESWREDVVLKALQGDVKLTNNPFFCSIWTPSLGISWPPPVQDGSAQPPVSSPLIYYPGGTLNASQDIAVQRICSEADKDRIVLIQGPPGTGKTTVIAASVLSIMEYGDKERTIWLVAHSNVAVKNIAEKLAKVGFYEFKLLVSHGFHYDWHEHLYERLEHCFIRSDFWDSDLVDIDRRLLETRVILCTLGSLSHPNIAVFTDIAPIQTIIFDEASQIEVGDYLPLLDRFPRKLKKMVFIGDDRQLAPYGQDGVQQLQSVFEFPHLRRQAHFLNTQYRMPVFIGNFISRHVYGHQLKTDHNIDSRTACRFLDVKRSQEKRSGKSWTNEPEISVIIHLARLYHRQGKQYRVITPYDAQRSAIEKQLELAKIPWEDKCFNVDSFQGNEEDHIIVSLVRSGGIGFLNNVRRTNVMLTRCKISMIICTSRKFVTTGKAANTLVGKLAIAMGPEGWLDSHDIVRGVLP